VLPASNTRTPVSNHQHSSLAGGLALHGPDERCDGSLPLQKSLHMAGSTECAELYQLAVQQSVLSNQRDRREHPQSQPALQEQNNKNAMQPLTKKKHQVVIVYGPMQYCHTTANYS
jgi:hypothetical protein